jgi:uncharacterized protein YecT (DUF1311 family)
MHQKNYTIFMVFSLVVSISAFSTSALSKKSPKSNIFHTISSNSDNESGSSDSNSKDTKKRAPKGITKTFYTCIDKAQSTIDTSYCLSAERSAQDARLNKVYKELLATLKGKSKDSLVVAERAWVDLASKDEDLESTLYGDEQVDNLQRTENQAFRICERANTLEKYLDLAKDN